MSMNFGNTSYHENEFMLHSLPGALHTLVNQGGSELNENMMPITTQNYVERYKDLEGNYEELKSYYKKLKADHSRFLKILIIFIYYYQRTRVNTFQKKLVLF